MQTRPALRLSRPFLPRSWSSTAGSGHWKGANELFSQKDFTGKCQNLLEAGWGRVNFLLTIWHSILKHERMMGVVWSFFRQCNNFRRVTWLGGLPRLRRRPPRSCLACTAAASTSALPWSCSSPCFSTPGPPGEAGPRVPGRSARPTCGKNI